MNLTLRGHCQFVRLSRSRRGLFPGHEVPVSCKEGFLSLSSTPSASVVDSLGDLSGLRDFESAGRAVLAFLRERLGFGLWMLTRTQGDDWIVLQTEDQAYGVQPGSVFRWADSFCSRMVRGDGPRVAPDSDFVPAYAAMPIRQDLPIRAYIGVPLTYPDGTLFGTLCAIDPDVQPDAVRHEQALIELLAALLSTLLHHELRLAQEVRRGERLQLEAMTDALTGLLNRRAWDQLLDREEDRCRRYGHAAAVFMIDLDRLKAVNDLQGHAAGDALIVAAASALQSVIRDFDVLARLGGDEFGIVAVECDAPGARQLHERLLTALQSAGVEASVGLALRHPAHGLVQALADADRAMLARKRERSQGR